MREWKRRNKKRSNSEFHIHKIFFFSILFLCNFKVYNINFVTALFHFILDINGYICNICTSIIIITDLKLIIILININYYYIIYYYIILSIILY